MEAEAYLNRLPMWANKKNSLKDIRIFLDQMGGPDRKIPAIHVAGTNGKGSVCAFMTSVLKKAGLRTGTFISPIWWRSGTFSYKRGNRQRKMPLKRPLKQ